MNEDIIQRAQNIKAILTDIDGIWTDGKINCFLRENGQVDEFKSFHVLDGFGALMCGVTGLQMGIITGRRHEVTLRRAQNLGVKYLYQGFLSKLGPLEDILKKENLTSDQVAYIGDDLTDLPLLAQVGLAVTVPGAVDAVKQSAHYITTRKGGEGAFRELVDLILSAQGRLDPLVQTIARGAWQNPVKIQTQTITSQEGIS